MAEDKAHHQSVLHREPTCSHWAASKNLHIKISSHHFHRSEMIFGVGQQPIHLGNESKGKEGCWEFIVYGWREQLSPFGKDEFTWITWQLVSDVIKSKLQLFFSTCKDKTCLSMPVMDDRLLRHKMSSQTHSSNQHFYPLCHHPKRYKYTIFRAFQYIIWLSWWVCTAFDSIFFYFCDKVLSIYFDLLNYWSHLW